jgi:hypothetical protein
MLRNGLLVRPVSGKGGTESPTEGCAVAGPTQPTRKSGVEWLPSATRSKGTSACL